MSTPLDLAQVEFNRLYDALQKIDGLDILTFANKSSDGGMRGFSIKVADCSLRNDFYAKHYLKNTKDYGLPLLGLEESICNDDGLFKVVGWDPDKKKSPILVECLNTGSRYKMPVGLFLDVYHSSLKEPL